MSLKLTEITIVDSLAWNEEVQYRSWWFITEYTKVKPYLRSCYHIPLRTLQWKHDDQICAHQQLTYRQKQINGPHDWKWLNVPTMINSASLSFWTFLEGVITAECCDESESATCRVHTHIHLHFYNLPHAEWSPLMDPDHIDYQLGSLS